MSKQDPPQVIKVKNYFRALSRWEVFWMHEIQEIPRPFHTYLRITKNLNKIKKPGGIINIHRNATKKIHALNSPHWFTFLKVYKSRYYDKNIPCKGIING